MVTLSTELGVQNRTLRQVKREGRIALYEVYGPNGVLYGFEVVIIKVAKARFVFDRQYPEREVYPANEDWGSLAWSYGRNSRNLAEECFAKCLARPLNASRETDLDLPRINDG